MPPVLTAIPGLIALLLLVGLLIASRKKVAKPTEAFIITGRRGKEVRNPETGLVSTDLSGQKVVMGGGVFVVPFIQRLHVLDLSDLGRPESAKLGRMAAVPEAETRREAEQAQIAAEQSTQSVEG